MLTSYESSEKTRKIIKINEEHDKLFQTQMDKFSPEFAKYISQHKDRTL